MMEFHISRKARERYRFADSLFSYNGNVVFANLAACREFAHRMNQVREADKNPDQAVHAGQLFAMGLIDEASHVLMARYREQFDPEVMTAALDWFAGRVGSRELDTLLLTFVEHFPGQSVIAGRRRRDNGLQVALATCRIAPPRLKNCFCCGRPTATRRSSHSKSCLKTSRWQRKRSTGKSPKSCRSTLPRGR